MISRRWLPPCLAILAKPVVVDRELMAVDAELHADLESLLLEDGSQQKLLWGINLYPPGGARR